MKIAFVKPDVYQDLYVQRWPCTPADLLFSSIARVGPIGLFTQLAADFYIVKEEDTPECRAWEKFAPHGRPDWFRLLKTQPFAATPFPEAKFFQPGSALAHDAFSVAADEVNWSRYDIVISVNFAVPTRIVDRHREVLWCYLIGEANAMLDQVYFGYDVALNQETRGIVASRAGVIDFPYTFASATCLEDIMRNALGRAPEKRGIFIEVNSVSSRPARAEPSLDPLLATGQPLRMHRQNIRENLIELYDAKYFVKTGGRFVRGNSLIEAISCGTLALMDPAQVHHAQLLPKDTWVGSADEARRKIEALERNPAEYQRLLAAQRALVQQFAFDAPLESLKNCLRAKRTTPPPPRRSPLRRAASKLKRTLRSLWPGA